MDKNEDFELEFDFEKEYGISPEDIMSPEYDSDDDFDMDLLADIPMPEKKEVPAQPEPVQDISMDDMDFLDEVNAQEGPDDEALTYNEFDGVEEPVPYQPEMPVPPPAPQKPRKPLVLPGAKQKPRRVNPLKERAAQGAQEQDYIPASQQPIVPLNNTAPAPRRKKRSQERIIKEDYLPVGIAGVALLLCLIFIIGAVVRNIDRNNEKLQNELKASEQAASEALRQEEEAQYLRNQAAILASSYDYQGAIDLLNSFSGDMTKFTELQSDKGKYIQLLSTVVEITNFSQVPNLSFNPLIADPSRAFKDEKYANAYNQNMITIDEFSKILDQLYAKGYVLVNFDSFIEKTTDAAGNVTYTTKPIYLPADKKPLMITETLVNYFNYQIDGDGDGKADAKGGGFASKLLVKDGEITCEMVNAEGETVYGAFDLVPILNAFIEEHPEFSYKGARATLGVTGHEGIFGHRVNNGDSQAIADAQEVVQALREEGYLIACNTYENLNYATSKATDIQADLKKWSDTLGEIVGNVDILIYARGVDISDYSGPKFNVLYSSGYRIFISSAKNGLPTTQVNNTYIHQDRIMVTGSLMVNSPSTLANYFTVSDVISGERGL